MKIGININENHILAVKNVNKSFLCELLALRLAV